MRKTATSAGDRIQDIRRQADHRAALGPNGARSPENQTGECRQSSAHHLPPRGARRQRPADALQEGIGAAGLPGRPSPTCEMVGERALVHRDLSSSRCRLSSRCPSGCNSDPAGTQSPPGSTAFPSDTPTSPCRETPALRSKRISSSGSSRRDSHTNQLDRCRCRFDRRRE
jgi:hypothetical protein